MKEEALKLLNSLDRNLFNYEVLDYIYELIMGDTDENK